MDFVRVKMDFKSLCIALQVFIAAGSLSPLKGTFFSKGEAMDIFDISCIVYGVVCFCDYFTRVVQGTEGLRVGNKEAL